MTSLPSSSGRPAGRRFAVATPAVPYHGPPSGVEGAALALSHALGTCARRSSTLRCCPLRPLASHANSLGVHAHARLPARGAVLAHGAAPTCVIALPGETNAAGRTATRPASLDEVAGSPADPIGGGASAARIADVVQRVAGLAGVPSDPAGSNRRPWLTGPRVVAATPAGRGRACRDRRFLGDASVLKSGKVEGRPCAARGQARYKRGGQSSRTKVDQRSEPTALAARLRSRASPSPASSVELLRRRGSRPRPAAVLA